MNGGVRHPQAPRMCCMNHLNVCVLDYIWDDIPVVDAYTPIFHMQVLPVAMNVGTDLRTSSFVVSIDTVTDFL